MMIKSVVRRLAAEDPHIKIHSTLSPMPGFRQWVLKVLQEDPSKDCSYSAVSICTVVVAQCAMSTLGCPVLFPICYWFIQLFCQNPSRSLSETLVSEACVEHLKNLTGEDIADVTSAAEFLIKKVRFTR